MVIVLELSVTTLFENWVLKYLSNAISVIFATKFVVVIIICFAGLV